MSSSRSIDSVVAKARAREKRQREIAAGIACDQCLATHEEIAGEQARLRAEFYARNPHLLAGAVAA